MRDPVKATMMLRIDRLAKTVRSDAPDSRNASPTTLTAGGPSADAAHG